MASRPWMAAWCGGRYTASGAYAAATLSKIPAFQCRAQSLPIWRMMTAALLVLADLRAVRMDLRSAPFARFFAVVFMADPLTKNFCGGILQRRGYWSACHVTEGCEAPVELGISPFREPRYVPAGIFLASS